MGCGCGCGCNGGGNKKRNIITLIIFAVLIIGALIWKFVAGPSGAVESPASESVPVEQTEGGNEVPDN